MGPLVSTCIVADLCVASFLGLVGVGGPTKLVQHVGDIFPVHSAVAVPVQDLKAFAQGAHLRRL